MFFQINDFIDCNRVVVRDRNFGDSFGVDFDYDYAKFKAFDISDDKDFVAFNKLYDAKDKGCVSLLLHESINLVDCVPLINKYQIWLNGEECKNQLITEFCKFVNGYSGKMLTTTEVIDNNWYDGLEINSALILIDAGGKKIRYSIGCLDKWHILYVLAGDYKILSAIDEYADPENATGYNGVW